MGGPCGPPFYLTWATLFFYFPVSTELYRKDPPARQHGALIYRMRTLGGNCGNSWRSLLHGQIMQCLAFQVAFRIKNTAYLAFSLVNGICVYTSQCLRGFSHLQWRPQATYIGYLWHRFKCGSPRCNLQTRTQSPVRRSIIPLRSFRYRSTLLGN